jgi:hypothetical protein
VRTSIAPLPLGRLIPVPWCGRSKQRKKGRKKRKKESSQKTEKIQKKERLPHCPSGKREPIRLGEGVLRHSSPWLRSFLGCTVHALVAISP